MYNSSVDYSGMASWGYPQPAQPSPVYTPTAGLRAWEMNQPGLVSAAGGLPYGAGDYAANNVGGGSPVPTQRGWFDRAFGSTYLDQNGNQIKDQGVVPPLLGAAQGVFNAWLGMKQYGLAKAQLAESQKQFNLNYDAQRTTTNAQLRDRQLARVASNPGAYQSVGDYMALNGIGGR